MGPISVFKLKTAINVDDLMPIQYFDFRRKVTRQGKQHVDTISCKIRGIRNPEQQGQRSETNQTRHDKVLDDGTRRLKIEGCEYRIPKETLIEFLSSYGEIVSPFTEEFFSNDSNKEATNDGTNRMGIYLVTMRLNKEITQLLPILGRRIKIQYRGIQRQCTNRFGNHSKQVCQTRKMTWPTYVKKFMEFNPDIPRHLFGKWHQTQVEQHSKEGGPLRDEQSTIDPDSNRNDSSSMIPNANINGTLPDIQSGKDTASWVSTHSSALNGQSNQAVSHEAILCEKSKDNCSAPNQAQFLIPNNPIEHDKMISKMIEGGLLRAEAEQNIQNRKAAFNKACREHKKSEPKQSRSQNKKPNKSSKHVGNTTLDYGY